MSPSNCVKVDVDTLRLQCCCCSSPVETEDWFCSSPGSGICSKGGEWMDMISRLVLSLDNKINHVTMKKVVEHFQSNRPASQGYCLLVLCGCFTHLTIKTKQRLD
jgi:hypothetical protein